MKNFFNNFFEFMCCLFIVIDGVAMMALTFYVVPKSNNFDYRLCIFILGLFIVGVGFYCIKDTNILRMFLRLNLKGNKNNVKK